ncbi:MAG TPA: hypothetical protein VME42_08810 [Steroidobacteraceae bacterium]|nr:hypothetical protein [Steroidobacteraceae bacterium]
MDARLAPLDQLPGFRRRLRITPRADSVCSELEDDYHRMSVTLVHDGRTVSRIEPLMQRMPWTTCPGAVQQLQRTFTAVALADFAARGEKRENCTHLHDLAVLGAAHALDAEPLVYDILVCDPIEGRRRAELRRDGAAVLAWSDEGNRIVEPAQLAGTALDKLRPWIESLPAQRREAARLLQWGAIIANGRSRSFERQSDARALGVGRCYTFQAHRVAAARRIDDIRDFSQGTTQLLARTL